MAPAGGSRSANCRRAAHTELSFRERGAERREAESGGRSTHAEGLQAGRQHPVGVYGTAQQVVGLRGRGQRQQARCWDLWPSAGPFYVYATVTHTLCMFLQIPLLMFPRAPGAGINLPQANQRRRPQQCAPDLAHAVRPPLCRASLRGWSCSQEKEEDG